MSVFVRRYSSELADDWAAVLDGSKNGLFLFHRDYMEYHSDRFEDLSSIAYIEEKPVALFPLARSLQTGEISSHPGLTFGGVVLLREIRGDVALAVIDKLLDGARDSGAGEITVKILPQIFASYPAGELEYALWRRGFRLSRRDLSSVLPLVNGFTFNTLKRRAVGKARKCGVSVGPVGPVEFHKLVSDVLKEKHEVAPVHSASEMEILASKFPRSISIVGAWREDRLLAGSMVYRYGHIWHTQYLACSNEGRECGALDLVISHIKEVGSSEGAALLSFGTSTESAGTVLNEGLLWQKESFGARSVTHDFMVGAL